MTYLRKIHSSLPPVAPAAPPPRPIHIGVGMNHKEMIEVKRTGPTGTIWAPNLGGCLVAAAIVENDQGDRYCGLGHYDAYTLRQMLRADGELVVFADLFRQIAQAAGERPTKSGLVIMTTDWHCVDRPYIRDIAPKARAILGCARVKLISYNPTFLEVLKIVLPNNQSGAPSFRTALTWGTVGLKKVIRA